MLDVPLYLARIRYDGPLLPTLDTLRALHVAHLMAVPFEDVDVYLGRPIDLSEGALFEKIVRRSRGGFCYELNGLFAGLLRALGFDVRLLNAQVTRQGNGFGPPFDHLTLLVELERPWLADVGYPRSALTPLPIDTEEPQESDGVAYRIVREDEWWYVRRQPGDGWVDEFRFDLEPRRIEDYIETCRFHETSPESPFYRWLGCTIATAEGRVTLSDDKLIVHRDGVRTETPVGADDVTAILQERFGVVLADFHRKERLEGNSR